MGTHPGWSVAAWGRASAGRRPAWRRSARMGRCARADRVTGMSDRRRLSLLDRVAPRIAGSLLVLVAFAFQGSVAAQEPQAAEVVQQGRYTLHKFQQAIGEETWTLSREPSGLVLQSKFKFTDRGSPVQLAATLTTAADLTPKSFAVKGHVS